MSMLARASIYSMTMGRHTRYGMGVYGDRELAFDDLSGLRQYGVIAPGEPRPEWAVRREAIAIQVLNGDTSELRRLLVGSRVTQSGRGRVMVRNDLGDEYNVPSYWIDTETGLVAPE